MYNSNFRHFVLWGLMALSTAGAAETAITTDGQDKGRTFDGIFLKLQALSGWDRNSPLAAMAELTLVTAKP